MAGRVSLTGQGRPTGQTATHVRLGQLLCDIWDMWDDFHLSINWGNIATVTVAIVAIIVSARFNVPTLRRSAAQFQHQRRDARDDKLRAEVAALLVALGERGTQHNNAFTRLVAFVNALDLENLSDDELQEPARIARTIAYEEMADVYRRISMHGMTIHMLTNDRAITGPIEGIQAALVAEQAAYTKALSVPDVRQMSWDFLRLRISPSDAMMAIAERHLVAYCLQDLGIGDLRSPAG
jgi:hypothetical protein